MDQKHQEYCDYYKARMLKYAHNPAYRHSYESEKAIYEAIAGCERLEDFRGKMEQGNLAVKNAIAQVKDQAGIRLEAFMQMKEVIRARAPQRLLAEIDAARTDMEVASIASRIENEVGVEISIDQLTDYFYNDFTVMENIRVWLEAEIPDSWKAESRQNAEDDYRRTREVWATVILPRARQWKPGWDLDYNLIGEERHRRNIPVPDSVVKEMIERHKKLRGI